MKYCTKCGEPITSNYNFCHKCGNSFSEIHNNSASKNFRTYIPSILCAFFIATTICLTFYIFIPKEEPHEQEPTSKIDTIEVDEANEDKEVIPVEKDNPTIKKHGTYMSRIKELEVYAEESSDKAITQLEMNTNSYDVYVQWDNLINEIYQHIKTIMDESTFAALEKDELEWIKEKDNAIEEAAAKYEGGSIVPLIRNTTASSYTQNRCYYLLGILRQLEI